MSCACHQETTRIELVSFRDAQKNDTFTETFPRGYFRMNSEQSIEIVLELEPRILEVPHLEKQRASRPSNVDSSDGVDGMDQTPDADPEPLNDLVWTSQLLHIQLLWHALPGKSYAESTQTNAAITYCLVNGDNAISYEGAGFVFFKLSRDGEKISGRIESASLRPTRFGRDPIDLFGPCRITGEFHASVGHREVASVRQRLRRLLGKPAAGGRPSTDRRGNRP
ncbi:MAG: hypothetical protein KF841_06630 [Phycisphaerae bacterium]|nr:hypothetical protein [Phycisphaerae bacterium]